MGIPSAFGGVPRGTTPGSRRRAFGDVASNINQTSGDIVNKTTPSTVGVDVSIPGTVVTAGAGTTVLTLAAGEYDTSSFLSGNTITVPRTGAYLVCLELSAAVAGSIQSVQGQILSNHSNGGASNPKQASADSANATGLANTLHVSVCCVMLLSAGETIQFKGHMDGTGAGTFSGYGSAVLMSI